MAVLHLLSELIRLVIWMGGFAQLVGMPVAWLRLRNTSAWRERPPELRRIDLLSLFILPSTVVAIAWGWLLAIVIALGGFGLSWQALLIVMWGAPVIFVPWWAMQLDEARFRQVAEAARRNRERKQKQTQEK
jgi:hypothetical protein